MTSLMFWNLRIFFKSRTVLLPEAICRSNQYLLVRLKTFAQLKTIILELAERVM